ncbi:MAG: exopolyphosphatase [Candidatus Aminicenantes bacterium]|nr:exopolyphosphatase [Candidatus Aminicenantes bacterium]NIM81171.1 exopolyphosphatase [Candidatus Aminicenantes bacterium]NIN20546.1 exopolyphosphatase [Candidatus Aminicenantes bacterium]NIN44325.1 exopolyphosphatase [Candidatus Aminicenantes bacterium]NIN87144.1 exopolyphosphatase [Candidatus Aminicenantes bacterium]
MRLLTRSDFDGLVCAVLLSDAGVVDSYKFVHPKDIQDGKVDVDENDVLANVPYVPGCGLWFDHHSSEWERLRLYEEFKYKGRSENAPSCARVIYNYYGGEKRFAGIKASGLLEVVDKSNTAQLTREEIMYPGGWILLSFIMDPRTGLGRFKDYRISNYHLMEELIQYCRTMPVGKILEVTDVKERVNRYYEQEKAYEEMIKQNSTVYGNVLVINLLDVEPILSGNRFKEYVLFPDQNISIRIMWGYRKQNIVFTCGYSILNRTAKMDVGSLMLKYGGGGHRSVGTCQVSIDRWEQIRNELVEALRED